MQQLAKAPQGVRFAFGSQLVWQTVIQAEKVSNFAVIAFRGKSA